MEEKKLRNLIAKFHTIDLYIRGTLFSLRASNSGS